MMKSKQKYRPKYEKGDLVQVEWSFLSSCLLGVVLEYQEHGAYPVKVYHGGSGAHYYREKDLKLVSCGI